MSETAQDTGKAASVRRLLAELEARYAVFKDARPLAIGIDAEILAAQPEIDRKLLRTALKIHTGSTRYLKSTQRGEQRFNLAGMPVSELSAEHRERAAALLKQRQSRRQEQEQERKAREAEARRAEKLQQLAERFAGPSSRRGG